MAATAPAAPVAAAEPAAASLPLVVRPCASFEDCARVAALCGQEFKEECWGQGLSIQKWVEIEAEDLQNRPSWWRQIGLACEGERLLGVVVLTLEAEEDDSISWSEYTRRVGCGPTILSMLYDRVLDEALLEHECLIDFIAVAPEARGKGVGARLMAWAEQTGAAILAQTEAAAVAARGVDMTLWVAADNVVAVRLYQRAGYSVVRRTDEAGACQCLASRVHKWFLGHPVWVKMHKPLAAPPHLAACKPEQMSIPLAVATGAAARLEAQLVDVPLAPPEPAQPSDKAEASCFCASRQPHPAATAAPAADAAAGALPAVASQPGSPSRSLLHKMLGMPIEEVPPPASPSASSPAGLTPRIAAVGGAGAGDRAALAAAGSSAATKEGLGYTQLSLPAAPAAEPQQAALEAASAASASAASIADGSGGELSAAPSGACPDVFQFQLVELRELSTTSTTACA